MGEVFRVGNFLPGADAGAGVAQAVRAELILGDDGSTDGSVELMRDLAARHPFVRPQLYARSRGIAAAWRTGAEAAPGQHICIIDAHVQCQPKDFLRRELLWSSCDIVQGTRSAIGASFRRLR